LKQAFDLICLMASEKVVLQKVGDIQAKSLKFVVLKRRKCEFGCAKIGWTGVEQRDALDQVLGVQGVVALGDIHAANRLL